MIRPSQITPDLALKQLLQGNVKLPDGSVVTIYRQGERPTTMTNGTAPTYPKEFVEILYNGSIRSNVRSFEDANGYLALAIYCKTQNGVVNVTRVQKLLEQIESLVHGNVSGIFYYELDINNIISSSNNFINGYSAKILNMRWHLVSNASEIVASQLIKNGKK